MSTSLVSLAISFAIIFYVLSRQRLRRAEQANQRQLAELRQREREAVERFQAQQRALLNSMTEGLLVLDSFDRIQLTNRAFREVFNMPEALTGKTVLEALRLHELDEIVALLHKEEHALGVELELPALKSRWLEVNASSILDDNKQRLGAVLVFHDVTRLKQLENTRQEFVANVSHELRTPLSMIKGYAETLLGGASTDPEVSTRFLQTIEKHADRLARLIDDLLTISELESGRMNLNLQTVNLHSLVEAVFQDLRARAEINRVTLQNDVPAPLTVSADADRLKQVLWNLIENAIKYGKNDGCAVVSAKAINGEVEVSVQDNGRGIPAESLPRIFERFYRVDKARSREAGGTGLGLSIVKHIVQSHGGKVWAESRMEEGSTFYFTLKSADRHL